MKKQTIIKFSRSIAGAVKRYPMLATAINKAKEKEASLTKHAVKLNQYGKPYQHLFWVVYGSFKNPVMLSNQQLITMLSYADPVRKLLKLDAAKNELQKKITLRIENKWQEVFNKQARYKGNGIYFIPGTNLYHTDTRELFLMFVAAKEGIHIPKEETVSEE